MVKFMVQYGSNDMTSLVGQTVKNLTLTSPEGLVSFLSARPNTE